MLSLSRPLTTWGQESHGTPPRSPPKNQVGLSGEPRYTTAITTKESGRFIGKTAYTTAITTKESGKSVTRTTKDSGRSVTTTTKDSGPQWQGMEFGSFIIRIFNQGTVLSKILKIGCQHCCIHKLLIFTQCLYIYTVTSYVKVEESYHPILLCSQAAYLYTVSVFTLWLCIFSGGILSPYFAAGRTQDPRPVLIHHRPDMDRHVSRIEPDGTG